MIKVADFGLTEDMYGTNYFRRRKNVMGNEEKVPIRWMAPESIKNDIYNESTDVVRYDISISSFYISIIYECLSTVGIWCNCLGVVHLWESPLLWNSCHECCEGTKGRTETGETRKHSLLP